MSNLRKSVLRNVALPADGAAGGLRGSRITVQALFQQHVKAFSKLPGQVSEFRLSENGFEWRCEYNIGPAPDSALDSKEAVTLQFSLQDVPDQALPDALLSLVHRTASHSVAQRSQIALEDLAETHESLNGQLAGLGANVSMLGNTSDFIAALAQLRETLDGLVNWA